jgi:hypothetical protein
MIVVDAANGQNTIKLAIEGVGILKQMTNLIE